MRACFPECKSTFAYIRKICEIHSNLTDFVVEVTGFEPATFWSRNPNKCSFLSSPDRKRRAFSLLFCLRRTGGDRFGCRKVAYCLGMWPDVFARTGPNNCTGISIPRDWFCCYYNVSPHAVSFKELIIGIVQYLFPTLWYVFVGEQIGRVAIRKIRNC